MLVNWIKHAEPSEPLKSRLVLKQEDSVKRIYEVDGEQLMHNLLTGDWWLYHPFETSEEA